MRQERTRSSVLLNANVNLLGESPAFRLLLEQIERFARSNATVLIEGETGTGKELAARAIHYCSARGKGPFIPINCGSLPDSLVGSELFGHARGAFTDARDARQGLIAQAEGGTLFLDELETLSVYGQVALLRFLQDHEYRPLGAAHARTADVRVIGATNADLLHMARQGAFREDLLYRLNVLMVSVPPLRARLDDAVLLAQAFLRELCAQYDRPGRSLHPLAIEAVRGYDWPGNVRQLENLMHREFLLSDARELLLELVPCSDGESRTHSPSVRVDFDTPSAAPLETANKDVCLAFREAKARVIAEFEREYVRNVLRRSHGNVSLAARFAGKERSRFSRLLRKYQLSAGEFRAP